MSLAAWSLAAWLRAPATRRKKSTVKRPAYKRYAPLGFESLEERRVLAALTWDVQSDYSGQTGTASPTRSLRGLALSADDAYIYQAFVAIGLIPDGGVTWHLVRQLGRKRAFEMIAECEKMSAARCVELGLANRVVPAAQLLEETLRWAHTLAQKAPLALRYAKEALARATQLDLADTISCEARLQNLTVTSDDAKEGVTAFFEKRKPVFKGR